MRGHLPATSIRLGRSYHQWRRQTKNSFIFSSLWSNLTANYPSIVDNLPKGLAQMSTNTALVTILLVIEQLLHSALKSAVSAP